MERFTIDPKVVPSTWRIGRRAKNSLIHAFDLKRRDDGGISISNVEGGISDSERHLLMTHFGAPLTAVTGGERDGMDVTVQQREPPGTLEHFVQAVYSIPSPFRLMGGAT